MHANILAMNLVTKTIWQEHQRGGTEIGNSKSVRNLRETNEPIHYRATTLTESVWRSENMTTYNFIKTVGVEMMSVRGAYC